MIGYIIISRKIIMPLSLDEFIGFSQLQIPDIFWIFSPDYLFCYIDTKCTGR